MNSTIHSRYTMLADFYLPTATSSGRSGQIQRSYDYERPIVVQNLTEGILGGGIRVVGSTESWGEDYEEIEWAKMYIAEQTLRLRDSAGQDLVVPDGDGGYEEVESLTITRRFRVGNIRSRITGSPLWVGDDGDSIEFIIQGITPIHDPFIDHGAVEYEILLKGVTGD